LGEGRGSEAARGRVAVSEDVPRERSDELAERDRHGFDVKHGERAEERHRAAEVQRV
jgi:hypothetical protein